MASLSRYQLNGITAIIDGIENIDPGNMMMQNVSVADSEGNLVGDISWNSDTDAFEWTQV